MEFLAHYEHLNAPEFRYSSELYPQFWSRREQNYEQSIHELQSREASAMTVAVTDFIKWLDQYHHNVAPSMSSQWESFIDDYYVDINRNLDLFRELIAQSYCHSDYEAIIQLLKDRIAIDIGQRSNMLLKGIREIILEHAAPILADDATKQIKNYLSSAQSSKEWIEFCKHLLTYPAAEYLKDRSPDPLPLCLPPKPRLSFCPKGRFRRFFRNRLNAYNDKNTHLWYSWFQAKRCTLPVDESFIVRNYMDHMKTLGGPDRGNPEIINQILNCPGGRVYVDKKNVCQAFLEDFRKKFESKLKKLRDYDPTPTRNACWENTKQLGGGMEVISGLVFQDPQSICSQLLFKKDRLVALGEVNETTKYFHVTRQTELFKMAFDPFTLLVTEYRIFRSDMAIEDWIYRPYMIRYSKAPQFVSSPMLPLDQMPIEQPKEQLQSEVDTMMNDQKYRSLHEPCSCMIQGILEPNKVRVISKGNIRRYHAVRCVQKALWQTLQEYPCFRLTGRPVRLSDIYDIDDKTKKYWASVDYKASTDYISWDFTSRIFEFLTQGVEENLLLRTSLQVYGLHDLYYKVRIPFSENCSDIDRNSFLTLGPVHQTTGQLMGSVLSFPILCVANLLTALAAGIPEDKVLVNGDDMLFKGTKEEILRHAENATGVGLVLSQGKTYYHEHYANINSTSFTQRPNGTIKQIEYLTTGLMHGVHKVQSVRQQRLLGPYGYCEGELGVAEVANLIMKGSLDPVRALRRYIMFNQERIKRETQYFVRRRTKRMVGGRVKEVTRTFRSYRNLFIHPSLGGMGVVAPSGFRVNIRKIDCKLAGKLLSSHTTTRFYCSNDWSEPTHVENTDVDPYRLVDQPALNTQVMPLSNLWLDQPPVRMSYITSRFEDARGERSLVVENPKRVTVPSSHIVMYDDVILRSV